MPKSRPKVPSAAPTEAPVLAVVEDGPAGPAVIRAAVALARSAEAGVVLLVPVEAGAGLTSDPAVARTRHRRLDAEAAAIAARAAPALDAAGLRWSVRRLDVRRGDLGRWRAATAVRRLATRLEAAVVVCPTAYCSSSGLHAEALRRRTPPVPAVGVDCEVHLERRDRVEPVR